MIYAVIYLFFLINQQFWCESPFLMCCLVLQIAARTLGDLVRKLGEKILPEIIPILEDGLRSDKSDERQGVCIGLSEIMKSTSKDAVGSSGTALELHSNEHHC